MGPRYTTRCRIEGRRDRLYAPRKRTGLRKNEQRGRTGTFKIISIRDAGVCGKEYIFCYIRSEREENRGARLFESVGVGVDNTTIIL